MNSSNNIPWQQVKPILLEVMEAPQSSWGERIAQLCGENQALAEAVRAYLDLKDAAGDFLEEGASLTPLLQPNQPPWEGRLVGSYRLIKEIGRGGMGTVFLAERADAVYDQKVALKLLSSGLDAPRMYEDFERERQMLAHLEHRYIARILDGGTTQEGRPFYAMEYIDGKPIDRYCQDEKLTVSARLALFRKVCEAVHYAHQNLIIHRDLKPGNILITREGVPKLLDFGTAKMLTQPKGLPQTTAITRFRAMTPEYASPEQVAGKAMTTASDVYTLGILLFELLTGRMPYEFPTQAAHDVHRTICETQPVSLTRYWQDYEKQGDAGQTEAAFWQSTSQRMRHQLQGDLNVIVAKSLNKDPLQRYGTVDQLGQDISRYQKGLPIHAVKASSLKRLTKFVSRHRLATATAMLVAMTLTATLLAVFWQARVANRERQKAEKHLQEALHERTQAQRQSRKSENVTNLLVDLFKVSDPYLGKNQDLSARHFLDHSAGQLLEQLSEEPELKASLMETVGRVYLNLGLAHQAEPLLANSLTLRQALLPVNHPDIARSHHQLGKVEINKNRFEVAESHLRQALTIREAKLDPNHQDLAENYHDLAVTLQTMGHFDQAEPLYRRTLTMNIAKYGKRHPEVARTQVELCELDMIKGAWDNVEAELFEALAIQKEALGSGDISVITTQQVLAEFWAQSGEKELSQTMFSEAFAKSLELLGADHPRSLLLASQHAQHFGVQGRHSEAEEFLRWVLEAQERVLGEFNLSVAGTHHQLAKTYAALGQWQASHCHFRDSLNIYRYNFGENHPFVAASLEVMTNFLSLFLNPDDLRDLLMQALHIRRATLGEDHPKLAKNYSGLGWLAYRLEDYSEAITWYQKMYDSQKAGGLDSLALSNTENILAILYRDQGDWNQAETRFERVLTQRRKLLPEKDAILAQTLVPFGELLLDMQQLPRAQSYLQEGLELRLADENTPAWLLGNARFFLGICQWLQEPTDEHKALIWRGYGDMQASMAANHPLLQRARTRLANLGLSAREPAAALTSTAGSN